MEQVIQPCAHDLCECQPLTVLDILEFLTVLMGSKLWSTPLHDQLQCCSFQAVGV